MDNLTVFDSQLYSSLFTQKDMRKIWSETAMFQSWLDFEIALAETQAELGIIPQRAAEKIAFFARLGNIDYQALKAPTEKTGMPIKPLLDQIIEKSQDQDVKDYLHWGSTTQDVLDTGQALRVKKALKLTEKQLIELLKKCRNMAGAHQATIMVARTNAQDALPTTWGLQICGYAMEISRHLDRLKALKNRACMGMFGGAVGNLSSLGAQGLKVRDGLMKKLDLKQPIGLFNGSQDHIVELVQFMALLHGSLQRIANDVELMGRTPIGELQEGCGKNSSSTMPGKSNPRISNLIQTLARLGFMYATGATNLMDQTDVRSASMRMVSWSILPEAFSCVSSSLDHASELIDNLIIFPQRMRQNFSASQNSVMSEAVMMMLAQKIGRSSAYNLVSQITKGAKERKDLQTLLLESEIMQYLSITEVKEALDPKNYLGCCKKMVEETIIHIDNQLMLKRR